MRHLLCRLLGFRTDQRVRTIATGFPVVEWGVVDRFCGSCGRRL